MQRLLLLAVAIFATATGRDAHAAQDSKESGGDQVNAAGAVATPAPFPAGYLDHEALGAALQEAAAANPGLIRIETLATSAQGRAVWLATLGPCSPAAEPEPGEAARPAILVVADLDADHVLGSQVALALIRQVAQAGKDDGEPPNPDQAGLARLLGRHTLYVVPRLNPDGVERVLKAPHQPIRTNLRPIDTDRDRREDEDGPEDLDGDGFITTLRVRDQAAWLIPDAADPRIVRNAEATKGERALVSEYLEGIDNDGDGALNEDPPGGVSLNRNWPHAWPEFDREAGATPVGEPETRALIRFAFDHPEIAAVLVYSLHDSLRDEPKREATTLDRGDLPYFVALSRLYREALKEVPEGLDVPTREPSKDALEVPKLPEGPPVEAPRSAARPPGLDGPAAGSMGEWAYHQYGAVGLSVRLWYGPSFPKTRPEGQPEPPEQEEARWLYWNDRVLGGQAFVPFRPFDHPTLGRVLLGGWKPGVRINPPADRIAAISGAQGTFLEGLSERLPRLAISQAEAKTLGGGLFEITAAVENPAFLPTALAQGVKSRNAGAVLVRLETGNARLLAGEPLHRIATLAGSGGSQSFRWIVAATDEIESVRIVATCPQAGQAARSVALPHDGQEPRS